MTAETAGSSSWGPSSGVHSRGPVAPRNDDAGLSFKGPRQPGNRRRDELTRIAAETQHQRRLRRCLDIEAAHGANDDTVFARGPFDRDVQASPSRVGHQMHALVRRLDREMLAEPAPECSDQYVALAAIQLPHPADVSREMALLHEGRDDRLAQAR